MARLFIGFGLPEDIKEEAAKWQTAKMTLPIRMMDTETLHATIVPPWEGDKESVISDFNKLFFKRKIDFKLQEIDIGTSPATPRLFWATGPVPDGFAEIKTSIYKFFNFTNDNSSVIFHITLARFSPEIATRIPRMNLPEKIDWQGVIPSVNLYESHLGQREGGGSYFEILASVPLEQ